MTRQRLSREQSREQTRERLLEAAHAMFMQKGYAQASVEDISTAAGYSRGAFYSNFDDKEQLFFELLRREGESIDRGFERILGGGLTDPHALRDALAVQYSALYRDDKCSLLWMEARIIALRDEKFRAQLDSFLEQRYVQITRFVEAYCHLTGTAPAAPPREIAIGLMALCEGVSFSYRCVPHIVDGKTAESVLAWFLKASIAVAAPADQPPAAEIKKAARKPAAARKRTLPAA
ncbi:MULTISPECIES: TetR/AcrR family transcriptional regulator [unclassified Herbaspirillum]|jgi:AcrR family transcriptional regulator|uniref:TetR/AcrR family transcriptional regulator n=1 Tax=unclassified Herbaspirillum TaxID=2624150 RepID=UPI0015856347|nr:MULTISPECIES: TetR/AcrR family transcriptional regulator [unclassified Herbaspirillum]MCI1004681.1 TetR/AcrR family transcriptional regulator [Herbaspirillum sp. C7C8]NUT60500.1 TetR/AcrR family transcriptional regulator [Herbaspirillum sp. C9C3]